MSTYDKSPFREALPTDSLVLSWGAAVGVVPEPAITELFRGLPRGHLEAARRAAAISAFIVGVLGGSQHRNSAGGHHR
jgi:hypothetical protein